MLKALTAYELYCDGCGEQFESSEFSIWATDGAALDDADAYDWQTDRQDSKHYCPMCRTPEVFEDD